MLAPVMVPGAYGGANLPPPPEEQEKLEVRVEGDPEPEGEEAPLPAHEDNLADTMDEGDLTKLAAELIALFDADLMSRADWEKIYTSGLDLIGLKAQEKTLPWPGACGVYHPVMAEAVARFESQAIMEVFPAGGPVRTQIIGAQTREREKQAMRIETDLNYMLTEVMAEYRAETEQLLFNLALAGSAFRKLYYDPSLGRPVAMFVPADDLIVPYGVSDLRSAPRFTHRMRKTPNDMANLMATDFYRALDLPKPAAPMPTETQGKIDKITGLNPAVVQDDRHTVLEFHCDWDLEDGVKPYIIAIDLSSRKVLSIRRNWREDDTLQRRVMHFVHYLFMPGLSFYGSGLIHMIGGVAKAATSMLDQLVDAGTLSNLQGGFKSRGLRIKGDETPIMPGEWRDVDVPGGRITDHLAFLPFKEPSNVLYQLMGTMVDEGRRFGSTTDLPVGQGNQQAPVGTTLALLERAMKMMSAVNARIHFALKAEFKILVEIVRDFMPDQYEFETEEPASRRRDLDDKVVSVIPVSDPNSSSLAQRIIQQQTVLQLAASAPHIYNLPELHRETAAVIGVKNIEKIIPSPDDMKPADPVVENMHILTGKPVKAWLYQDHEAHIRVHMAAAQDPKIQGMVGQSPQASLIMGAMSAHMAEHLAFAYRREIERQLGAPLPPPDQPLPEDVEVQLSQLVAEAGDKLLQLNRAEQQAKINQAAANDPVVQQQIEETRIRREELQRKVRKDEIDAELELLDIGVRGELETAKIATTKTIEGSRIGQELVRTIADTAIRKEDIAARERIAAKQRRSNGVA